MSNLKMNPKNEIKLNIYDFSIRSWQRKNMKEIDTITIQTYRIKNRDFSKDLENMKLFFSHFQMPITHLKIQFSEIMIEKDERDQFFNFLIQDVYPQYSDKITHLTLINIQQFQLPKKSKKSSANINFIQQFIKPLINLTHIQFDNKYKSFEINNDNYFYDFIQIISSDKQFNTINSLSLIQEINFQDNESYNKSRNTMMNFQIKLIEYISTMSQLKNLQISMENIHFNPEFYQKAYQNISKMTNLEQVGLNLWSNKCSLKQQISSMKPLTQFGKKLKKLAFITDSLCKSNDASVLKEILVSFEVLENFTLMGIEFKQKSQLDEFLDYFQKYQNLKKLNLDLRDVYFKNMNIPSLIFSSLKNQDQLQHLTIEFPEEQKFEEEEQEELRQFLSLKSKQLTYLYLRMYQFKNLPQSDVLFKEMALIENLKYLHLQLNEDTNCVYDAEEDGVQDIRNLKNMKYYLNLTNALLYNINKIVFYEQKNVKKLEFTHNYSISFSSEYRNICIPHGLISQLQKHQLKSLSFPITSSFIKDECIQVINNNKNTLKYLQYINIEDFGILPQLQYLQLIKDHYDPIPRIGEVMKKLPSLIQLNLGNSSSYWSFRTNVFEFDIQSNKYLTTVSSYGPLKFTHNWQREYLLKNQAMISHLIIYCQLVKPFLEFQADYVHWDLSIDF